MRRTAICLAGKEHRPASRTFSRRSRMPSLPGPCRTPFGPRHVPFVCRRFGDDGEFGRRGKRQFWSRDRFFSEDTTFPFTTGRASVFVRGETVRLTFGVENYPAFAISGSDVFINNNFAALHTLDGFKNLLTHEIGHTLGLADVEFASEFIDDNYDETDSATALATLTNSWARLVNPVDPGGPVRHGAQRFSGPKCRSRI